MDRLLLSQDISLAFYLEVFQLTADKWIYCLLSFVKRLCDVACMTTVAFKLWVKVKKPQQIKSCVTIKMKLYGPVLSRHQSTSFELQKLDLLLSLHAGMCLDEGTGLPHFCAKERWKIPSQPTKQHMLLYLLYLAPFDSGYQKGHTFSFFVFCPRTIMEFLSVFLSSEDIISGLNKWKNTSEVDSGQNAWLCF